VDLALAGAIADQCGTALPTHGRALSSPRVARTDRPSGAPQAGVGRAGPGLALPTSMIIILIVLLVLLLGGGGGFYYGRGAGWGGPQYGGGLLGLVVVLARLLWATGNL
jgi:hypothetical protein